MNFARLTVDDLENWQDASAAIPAIFAIPSTTDCSISEIPDSSFAIPLLFAAIPLLFGTDAQPAPIENSSKIAANSRRIANQEVPKDHADQNPTEK